MDRSDSRDSLPVHFYLRPRDVWWRMAPLVATSLIFAGAALTITGGLWIFGPTALLSFSLAVWLYQNPGDLTLIFTVSEAGISSKYWSFGLLPWRDIRSFEISEVHFDGVGRISFLDFHVHDRGKYGLHRSVGQHRVERAEDAPLTIPLAYVSFNAAQLTRLLQSRIDHRFEETFEAVAA